MPTYPTLERFAKATRGLPRSDLNNYMTRDGTAYIINGEEFNHFELGIDRKLAEIDRFTNAADALFLAKDAMKNPFAKEALK